MKKGTYQNINGVVVRAIARHNGCEGCLFNSVVACPQISMDNDSRRAFNDCVIDDVIFVKP